MASIVKRNNSYCVVYTYKHTNGTQKRSNTKNPSVPLWHPSAEL